MISFISYSNPSPVVTSPPSGIEYLSRLQQNDVDVSEVPKAVSFPRKEMEDLIASNSNPSSSVSSLDSNNKTKAEHDSQKEKEVMVSISTIPFPLNIIKNKIKNKISASIDSATPLDENQSTNWVKIVSLFLNSQGQEEEKNISNDDSHTRLNIQEERGNTGESAKKVSSQFKSACQERARNEGIKANTFSLFKSAFNFGIIFIRFYLFLYYFKNNHFAF